MCGAGLAGIAAIYSAGVAGASPSEAHKGGLARDGQGLPVRACSASPAPEPEMRTTAIAAGPRPEERAKLVGRTESAIATPASAAGERRQALKHTHKQLLRTIS